MTPGDHRSIPQDCNKGPMRGVHETHVDELMLDLRTIATAVLKSDSETQGDPLPVAETKLSVNFVRICEENGWKLDENGSFF